MARYYIGPAGWSYEDWEGIVYPAPRPRGFHPLSYLPRFVDIVEVNSTFYRPAPPALVESWLRRIAGRPDFLLALKLHQAFTHAREGFSDRDVDDVRRAADLVRLRGRLAALLVQFPWSFRNTPENIEYLRRLLGLFEGYPLAVEVRHAGWDAPAFYDLLRGRGAAFCNIDQPLFDDSIAPGAVSTTPDFAYVRLHGRNYRNWFREGAGRDDRYDYLYARNELEDWVARIRQLGAKSGKVYVVTNNHYRGQAMANALQIRNMITGQKVDVPEPMLEKYPVLREIVRAIRTGQKDLFSDESESGTGNEGGSI
ncbi:MAG TPA: DUF72 domain-containing protein [Candidatus Aminicenantes bacterium]|nr:DUF72 domain-containing protein [Candidatus Aminicenantes bacterium]HRY66002.1 DUF72 domain-containing protein [Candidatus Aminicenantes bacterium]HRZ72949.1 DUF72 domain-containing protein [Candidatus Aminicenantes bacterium]